jgi:hypothetical protein
MKDTTTRKASAVDVAAPPRGIFLFLKKSDNVHSSRDFFCAVRQPISLSLSLSLHMLNLDNKNQSPTMINVSLFQATNESGALLLLLLMMMTAKTNGECSNVDDPMHAKKDINKKIMVMMKMTVACLWWLLFWIYTTRRQNGHKL